MRVACCWATPLSILPGWPYIVPPCYAACSCCGACWRMGASSTSESPAAMGGGAAASSSQGSGAVGQLVPLLEYFLRSTCAV